MIYCWGAMVMASMMGAFYFWKKKLENAKLTLMLLVVSVLFPYISNQAGWWTAEAGRQPWIIYGVLRTSQGVSSSISASQVVGSLVMFAVIYSLLFTLFIFLLNRKIQHGPDESSDLKLEEFRAKI
jgi:cytochrome d ubiquinol oxidase subunit I